MKPKEHQAMFSTAIMSREKVRKHSFVGYDLP